MFRSMQQSNLSGKRGQQQPIGRPKTFGAFLMQLASRFVGKIQFFFGYGKLFMWIASVGFLFIALPAAIAHNNELIAKMDKLGYNSSPIGMPSF